MEINRIAELAKECNDLNNAFAKACYKRVLNILFTETGEPYVIDENVIDEYEKAKKALSDKIDELSKELERAEE